MKLVVGLGNPGASYRGTRHNAGFEVADLLAARHGLTFETAPVGPHALMAKWRRADDTALVAKPLTFMNLSGEAAGSLCRYFKIEIADVLIVCDDVNLPLGRLRARATGTEGGHNGLKSIAQHFGTIDYARLRVGVGRGDTRRELADHVRGRFPAVKVLYQTGFSDMLFEDRIELEEGAAFLEKPFTARGLREAVRLVLFGSINP